MTSTFSVPGLEGEPIDSFSFSGGRTVSLAPALTVFDVGSGWETWSNDYLGKVLWLDVLVDGNTAALTLPAGTMAFSLYVEPNFHDWFTFDITATSLGGSYSFLSQAINGNAGAAGFGFYTNDLLQPLETVTVTITGNNALAADGFALGQFALDGVPGVPDGGATVVLVGVAALVLAWRRRVASR